MRKEDEGNLWDEEDAQPANLRKPNRKQPLKEKTYNKTSSDLQHDGTGKIVSMTVVDPQLSRSRFDELAAFVSDPCVSIFLDTSKNVEVKQQQQPRNKLRNHMQELRAMLKLRDMEEDDIHNYLAPVDALMKNDEFWMDMDAGLALFIAKNSFYSMKMKMAPREDKVLDRTFYVAPLLPLIREDLYFYVLVISKKQCKLFKADSIEISQVKLDLPEDVYTFRGNEGRSNGGDNADEKTNIAVYFEQVDDIIWKELLNKERVPLVLAGVEYLLPIYRSVCDYKFVWPDALTGSREQQNDKELHKDALALVGSLFDEKLQKALSEYGNKSATELTSTVAAKIIAGSYYARVSHLFVRKGEHLFGSFDEQENRLELNHDPDEGGEDLLDNAIVNTISKGGEVYLLDKDQMPEEAIVAAVFRY